MIVHSVRAGLTAGACIALAASALAGGPKVGDAAPKWRVSEAKGVKKTVKIEEYKGKWVVVEFWGFW